MLDGTVICPRCEERVAVTPENYYFTIHRDSKNRPTELRVMEDGTVRHACAMSIEPRLSA